MNPSLLPEWDTSPYLENNNSCFRTFFEKFKIYKNMRVNENKSSCRTWTRHLQIGGKITNLLQNKTIKVSNIWVKLYFDFAMMWRTSEKSTGHEVWRNLNL